MTHLKLFREIPMSKAMREICKEEDFAFLGNCDNTQVQLEDLGPVEEECRERHHDRVRRRQEREQKEQERLKELEETRKEKDQQWRNRVTALAADREEAIRERAVRLRDFRIFQRKVLEQERELEPGPGYENIDRLLVRM